MSEWKRSTREIAYENLSLDMKAEIEKHLAKLIPDSGIQVNGRFRIGY